MAFQSNGPVMLALPAFRGTTRRIVLAAAIVFLLRIVLDTVSPAPPAGTMSLILSPALLFRGWVWQLCTYALLSEGLLNTLFAMLSIWFFGAALEEERGSRWLAEYALTAALAGGLLASLLSYAHLPGIGPYNSAFGLWPLSMALLLAFARMNPDAELRLYFVLRVKAKYLVAAFLLVYLLQALLSRDRFSVLVALCVTFAGFVFLRFAPRRGLRFAASEGWYGLRNAFYRAKRRRAAKQFTVYMRKQGKDVSVEMGEKYLESRDPSFRAKGKSDPNDKRWMN